MRISLIAGRDFDERDTAQSPKVVIVNQQFALKNFGTQNPIGKTFKIDTYKGDPQYEYEIVGLVKNTKYYDLREDDSAIAYYPQSQVQRPAPQTEILLRSQLPMGSLVP